MKDTLKAHMQNPAVTTSMEIEETYMAGWEDCRKRITKILDRFPMQCAAINSHLKSLHPSQPCEQLGERFE